MTGAEEAKIEFLERIIAMQQEQLDRYHEYMKRLSPAYAAVSKQPVSTPATSVSVKEQVSAATSEPEMSICYAPLFEFMNANLENLDGERILHYLESSEPNGNGMIGLVESVLCPDKSHLFFSLLGNGSFVKYKQNDGSFLTENLKDFSFKVCTMIHEYCKPHISDASEKDENDTENEENDENVLEIICTKNIQRVKNFNHFKFSGTQVRLIKKVFSGIKAK